MHYRQFGSTGLEISEVGFGTWGIGKSAWLGAEDASAPAGSPQQTVY